MGQSPSSSGYTKLNDKEEDPDSKKKEKTYSKLQEFGKKYSNNTSSFPERSGYKKV